MKIGGAFFISGQGTGACNHFQVWYLKNTANKRLHADVQTCAFFCGFAALHFNKKTTPVWPLVTQGLSFSGEPWGLKQVASSPDAAQRNPEFVRRLH